MKEILKIKGLFKKYSSNSGLEKTNLDLFEGEIFCLLGPSGAGKTTLLNCVSGFIRPDGGSIYLNAKEITKTPLDTRNIGVIYQNYSLFEKLTVSENIAFPLKARFYRNPLNYFKFDKKTILNEIYQKVLEISKLVKLENHLDKLPGQLSGGEQQRVAIARAMIFNPDFLCFDEPLAALDANLKRDLLLEIKLLAKKFNKTLLYVTHDQDEAFRIADRIAVINKGNIIQIGEPEELYDNPKNNFVADFLGDMNFFDVEKIEPSENAFKIHTKFNTQIFVNNIDNRDAKMIGVRPENLTINYFKPSTMYHFTGIIIDFNTIKGISTVKVKLNDNEVILVKLQSDENVIQKGKEIYLSYLLSSMKIISN